MTEGRRRFVICGLGEIVNPFLLPAAHIDPSRRVSGGERSLYELAHALQALGHSVELRGDLATPLLAQLSEATGVEVPIAEAPPRRPERDEIVVVPEGLQTPLDYAAALTSPGQCIMMVLAPPGLFGWPFTEDWTLPEPLTASADEVSTPRQLRMIARNGFQLWTHSRGLATSLRTAGVEHEFVGCGQPIAPAPSRPPAERSVDVVFVGANRWAPLARQAAAGITGTVRELGPSSRDELLAGIADARIVLLPARLEGTARIQIEARSVGTVPICLPNPYGEGLREEDGTIVVHDVEEMVRAAQELLDDSARLEELSSRARTASAELTDWSSYVGRVENAVSRLGGRPTDSARETLGTFGDVAAIWTAELQVRLTGSEESARRLEQAVAELTARVEALTQELLEVGDSRSEILAAHGDERASLLASCDELGRERDELRRERDVAVTELEALRMHPAVRASSALKQAVTRVKR